MPWAPPQEKWGLAANVRGPPSQKQARVNEAIEEGEFDTNYPMFSGLQLALQAASQSLARLRVVEAQQGIVLQLPIKYRWRR